MQDYLFFDLNKIVPGYRLKGGKKLPFQRALSFAKQMANAGFYFRQTGRMPETLSPEALRVTANGYLFLNQKAVNYVDFNESIFLKNIKNFFYALVFDGDFEDGRHDLAKSMQTYSKTFLKAIERAGDTGTSLVSFYFMLDELSPFPLSMVDVLTHFKIDVDWFEERLKEGKQIVVLPDIHLLSIVAERFGLNFYPDNSKGSLPFGSYNRLVSRFFYLNLPRFKISKRLPDTSAMWDKIRPLIGNIKEEIVFFERGENLDSFSLELFRKMADATANFKLFILEDRPFSSKYNSLLEKGEIDIFNVDISKKIEMLNHTLPEYSFQRILHQLMTKSANMFIPFAVLLRNGVEIDSEKLLDLLGVEGDERENLKKGKFFLSGERKGITKGGNCLLPLDSGSQFKGKARTYLNLAERGEISLLIEKIDVLQRFDRKVELSYFVESREDILNEIKGVFFFCANNYKKAVDYLGKSLRKEVFNIYLQSLYFLGRYSEVVAFCNKVKFYSDFFVLSQLKLGKELKGNFNIQEDTAKMEFYFLIGDFNSLKEVLKGSKKKSAAYHRYRAILKHYTSPTGDFKSDFEKAISVSKKENNYYELALCYKYFGNAYYYAEDFYSARDCYLMGLKIASEIENRGLFDDIEHNLAHVDIQMCELDRGYRYFWRFYQRAKKSNNLFNLVIALKTLAKINAFASRNMEAESYLLEALKIARKNKLKTEEMRIHFVLTTIYQDLGDFEKSEYHFDIFKKQCDVDLFSKEITYKSIELSYFKGEVQRAREYFENWKIDVKDRLQPFVHKWFKLLLYPGNLAQVYDFYFELEKCPLKHALFFMKAELLKAYGDFAFVLSDRVLREDFEEVKRFNDNLASVFHDAIIRKKKRRFDPHLFDLIHNIFLNAKNGELFTLQTNIEEVGKWAGVDRVEIYPVDRCEKDEFPFAVYGSDNRFCIVGNSPVDSEFYPVFNLILEMVSSHIKPVHIETEKLAGDFDCPFLGEIIGISRAVTNIKKSIIRVADYTVPVLIQGASGTGKELIAKALHYCSFRKRRRFVAINCAAIPENLLESELFGHEKGAFSGAYSSKKGLFEVAGDGTIFLDEIGDMPLRLQAKLLRVLQEREFTPLGSSKQKKVMARFIFATNRDLKKLVKEGIFREDLYFRISGFVIEVPPLNERRDDIPLLATHFLQLSEGGGGKVFSVDFLELLKSHSFRGNVRELQNIVMTSVILSGDSRVIGVEHLPDYIKPGRVVIKGTLKDAEIDFKRKYIKNAIERSNGNHAKAARMLGITRQRLYQLKKELGIGDV